jgi:hypothetical protein
LNLLAQPLTSQKSSLSDTAPVATAPAQPRQAKKKIRQDPELATLIAVYRKPSRGLWSLLIPGFLGVLAPAGYGLWRADYAYTHFGPVAAGQWSRPWFLLAAAALGAFILLAIVRSLSARQAVAVFQKGLFLRRGLFRSQKLLWEQIAGIAAESVQEHFLRLPLKIHHQALLYPTLGKPIRLPANLENLPELVSRIKASLYPRLLPKLIENFRAGQWLYFGPLAIQQQSLHLGPPRIRLSETAARKGLIPWSRIKHLTIRSGSLMVELHDHAPYRIPVAKIPNLELLLQIVQQEVNA